MAAALVSRRLRALGGEPVLRAGVVTDNGGHILDVRGLAITDPAGMERELPAHSSVIVTEREVMRRTSSSLRSPMISTNRSASVMRSTICW